LKGSKRPVGFFNRFIALSCKDVILLMSQQPFV